MITEINQIELDEEIYKSISKLDKFVSLNFLGIYTINSDISNDYLQIIITILDSLENIDGLILYEKQLKRIFKKWNWVVTLYKAQKACLDFIIEDNINSIEDLFKKIISHLEEEKTLPKESVSENQLSEYYKELQNKIFDLQNRRNELEQLTVEDFYGVEKQLSYFEDTNIDFVRDKIERLLKYWAALNKTYESLSDEKKSTLFVNYFNLINEMFTEIQNSEDEEVFTIDESELSKIGSEIIKFDEDVSNIFFEKKAYILQFSMRDGQKAYKLVESVATSGGNIITYLSDHKYYNQNRNPIEVGKIHPVNLKSYSDVVMWDEEDRNSSLIKKTGKVCVLDISPEIMNDFNCAFELNEEESIQIETGEYIKNIKYISLNRKFYDKDKDIIYVNQSCFDEITINNEVISVIYDREKYNFKLTKKNSSSIIDRKKMDSSEYNKQKDEMEQNYHKIEAILSEYISQLDEQTDESVKLKELLAKLETSRKRYMQ